MSPTTIDASALLAVVGRASTSAVADVFRARQPERLFMEGVRPMTGHKGTVAGPARTLRFLPARADLPGLPAGNLRMQMIDDLQPGEILVMDSCGGGGPLFGDMVGLRARTCGARAVITDGMVRDTAALGAMDLPVYARDHAPAPRNRPLVPWERDVVIQCGGALVRPGDWIVADQDGVLVVPSDWLDDLASGLEALEIEEAFCRTLLERGHPLAKSFPLPPALRPLFDDYRASGKMPTDAEVARASSAA